MSTNHGKFCWYDLMTTDVAGAKAFYGELIGLKAEKAPMPGMDYSFWMRPDGAPMGGVGGLPERARAMGAPPHWLLNVAVDDVDATAARVEKLGGKVYNPPADIPNIGRWAVLGDPQGAAFGVFKGAGSPPQPLAGVDTRPGGVAWHELMTGDLEGAKKFYGEIFGWKETGTMDMGPEMGTYWMYGHDQATSYGGMMKKPAMMPVSAWQAYITVTDARAAAARIPQLGGKIMHGPVEIPGGGEIVVATDPQGAAFAVYAPKK